jgi:hypothetical protein
MKSTRRTPPVAYFAIFFLGLAPIAAWAGDSPFVGDWKLEPSRSKLTDVMTVQRLAADKYTFSFAGGSSETIVTNGTDQPGMSGTTLSVSIVRPDAWKVVRKREGRTLITANWELSKDGDTLTDKFSQIAADGSASTVDYVYRRKGRGSGFAGTWVSSSEQIKFSYVLHIRPYGEDGLSIVNSSSQLTRTMKVDGRDYPNAGATAAVVPVSSLRRVDEQTLEITDKRSGGEVYDTQEVRLSSDNRTLTLTVKMMGRDEPNILVFQRNNPE